MMVRVAVCLLAVLAIFGSPALAQEQSKADVFAGYSLFRYNPATSGVKSWNMNGGSGSFAYNAKNWLGLVGDFGGYHNGNILSSGVSSNEYTYLFGPRISYRHYEKLTPFGQILFGGAHVTASFAGTSTSDSAFAWGLGGGVDAKINTRFSVRLGQFDYLMTRDRKSTRLNSSHGYISYAVFCLKKKKQYNRASPTDNCTPYSRFHHTLERYESS